MHNISSSKSLQIDRDKKDEISLVSIMQFIKDGRSWIAWTTLISTLFGVAYAFMAPPKYEATMSMEMASVAGQPVEAPNVLAEKMKIPLYYSEATYKACGVEDKISTAGQVLASQLKPIVNKNAPIVSLSFRANSAIGAQKCLESVLVDIKRRQAILSQPILEAKNSQLRSLMQKLDTDEKLSALLPTGHEKLDFNDPKLFASAPLIATAIVKGSEIRDLRNQINDMQIALLQHLTHDTSLITPIYAPDVEVEPRKSVFVLVSIFLGIFMGLLFFGVRNLFIQTLPSA